MDGTVVQGDVTVRQGANLHIIEGEATVEGDGYLDEIIEEAREETVDEVMEAGPAF